MSEKKTDDPANETPKPHDGPLEREYISLLNERNEIAGDYRVLFDDYKVIIANRAAIAAERDELAGENARLRAAVSKLVADEWKAQLTPTVKAVAEAIGVEVDKAAAEAIRANVRANARRAGTATLVKTLIRDESGVLVGSRETYE